MENATKALLIAAAVLIAILLISFGVYIINSTGDVINISARSYGEINVQIIMEELSGGGHQTMAAAQLPGETFDNALALLKNAIDTVNNKVN